MVYAYTPNFVSTSVLCHPLAAKTPNFTDFRTWAFCGVASWQHTEKVVPVSNGIKTNSFVAKSYVETPSFKRVIDKQTDRQTNKQTRAQQ